MTDERKHAAAWKAAVDGMPQSLTLYDYDDVPGSNGNPGTLPPLYALLTVEPRFGGLERAGRVGRVGWRATARAVGMTVDECRWAQKVVADAVHNERLLIDGNLTTPIAFESSQPAEYDDGRYSSLSIWTYAI